MLQLRHFELIARAIKAKRPALGAPELNQWQVNVIIMTDTLATTNPQFKRDKFYEACGMAGKYSLNADTRAAALMLAAARSA